MKRTVSIAAALALALAAAPVLAQSHAGHDSMAGHEMHKSGDGRQGTKIREARVEGFAIEYYLIEVKPMAGMKMKSHHLMTYIAAPDAKPVADAKVGYLIAGAGGAEQKAMAMAMDGGYGADVDLTAAGPDKVTVKIVAGVKTLIDEFTYPLPKQ